MMWYDVVALLFATVMTISSLAVDVEGSSSTNAAEAVRSFPKAFDFDPELDIEDDADEIEEEDEDEYDEETIERQRNLQLSEETPFEIEYAIVTEDQFIVRIAPQPLFTFLPQLPDDQIRTGNDLLNGRSDTDIQGMKTLTKGVVLDPVAVQLEQQETFGVGPEFFNAGGVQARQNDPPGKAGFFLTGVCTVTAQSNNGFNDQGGTIFLPTTEAQQCLYDLCLGDQGFNCVNLYSGGGYTFNQFERYSLGSEDKTIFTDNNLEPPLPPPFDLIILGGTGAFRLVRGTATLTAVAGLTRGSIQDNIPQFGSLVQILQVRSNIPLKRGPTDDGTVLE